MSRVADVLRRATGHYRASPQPLVLTGPLPNADVAVLPDDLIPVEVREQIRRPASYAARRAVPRVATANFESRPGWEEALQIAARLKLVIGATRSVVAVTGVAPADGGPLLAAQVAAAMAQIDHARVLVVEGNVASPKIGPLFGLSNGPGLLDLLEHRVELDEAVHPASPGNLYVLPLGEGRDSLASLLTSAAGAAVMRDIREHFRYVILDAGLIRRDPGGMLLASLADGVVLSVAVAARRRDEIVNFQQELRRLNIPLLGLVLTRRS